MDDNEETNEENRLPTHSFTLTHDVVAILKELAAKEERSLSFIARRLIRKGYEAEKADDK